MGSVVANGEVRGWKRAWLGLLATLWFAGCLSAGGDTVRLAILSEAPTLAPVADLLTATFSTNRQVVLVERDQLDRVLREQAGTAAGGRDVVRLGQLLGADGLLVLQLTPRGADEVLTCRLVAVKPGVGLVMEVAPWPLEKTLDWCQRIVPRFEPFFPKLQVARQDAIPVSVLNLRSAVRGRENQARERELTLRLIHRLTRERDLFVLERQHLHEALFEQQLQPEEESAFWTGRYLLDGVLDRDGFDPQRLSLHARLVLAQGAVTEIDLAGSRQDPAGVIDALADKVLAALHRQPGAAAWQPAGEARQYLDEAKWALRWSLWPEAQAASESAWALGLRIPEVAALRLRAYGQAVMDIDDSSGNLFLPAVPDPAALRPARRAAELFFQDTVVVLTNGSATNYEWFELGVHTLRRAASTLDGFYHGADSRPGNEEALAALREATRRLVPIVDACHLPGRQWEKQPRSHLWRRELEMLELTKWHQGGVWFDRPEEALPMFQQMLETGAHPTGLPRLAGWTWSDRKRLPAVMRQFIAALLASTNPVTQLEGRYLALEREPFDAEGRFHQQEAALCAALWELRTNLWDGLGTATLLRRTEAALCQKYRYIYAEQFELPPFTTVVHRLRQEFLQQAPSLEQIQLEQFFPPDMPFPRRYSVAEATELMSLVEQCRARLKPKYLEADRLNTLENKLRGFAGLTNHPATPPTQPKPVEFATIFPALTAPPAVTTVPFIPWRLQSAGFKPIVRTLLAHGGKLWAAVQDVDQVSLGAMNCPTVYVAADPRTGACLEIPFPRERGYPDAYFAVTEDSIYVSVGDHLEQYHFASKSWERVAVPIEGGASLTVIGETLYLGSRDSLLAFDLSSRAVRVLASSRRRPAENALDELWQKGPHVFAWPDGWLGVQSRNEVFSYDPSHGAWSHYGLPPGNTWFGMRPTISNDGVDLLLSRFNHQRFVSFRDHGRELVSSFVFDRVHSERLPKGRPETGFAEPRWDWPPAFDLEYSCCLGVDGGIRAWQPRSMPMSFNLPYEQVTFTDNRNATLLWFEPGRRQALPLAYRFEREGQPFDPFAGKHNSYSGMFFGSERPVPHFQSIPEGLVLCCAWSTPGHWLVSQAGLEAQLKALRALQPSTPATGGAR